MQLSLFQDEKLENLVKIKILKNDPLTSFQSHLMIFVREARLSSRDLNMEMRNNKKLKVRESLQSNNLIHCRDQIFMFNF